MSFQPEQIEALRAPLDRKNVKSRKQAGRELSYVEGWHAIAEANRIFGFHAWNRETVWVDCVWSGERPTQKGPKPAASYVARVRITVHAGGDVIVREGTGAGSGFGQDHGEAHESAIKEAETDAMKRALMTFGNPFGLALYDKDQREVADTPKPTTSRLPPPKPKPADDNPFDQPTAAEQQTASEIEDAFDDAETLDALRRIGEELKPDITALPPSLRSHISEKYKLKRKVLEVFREAAES